jgi:hypothetical protein
MAGDGDLAARARYRMIPAAGGPSPIIWTAIPGQGTQDQDHRSAAILYRSVRTGASRQGGHSHPGISATLRYIRRL